MNKVFVLVLIATLPILGCSNANQKAPPKADAAAEKVKAAEPARNESPDTTRVTYPAPNWSPAK
jgi:hypothetical protein